MTSIPGRILSLIRQQGLLPPGLILVLFVCSLGYLYSEKIVFLLFPFLMIAFIWGVQDFRRLYLLMWATIPFAVEMDLPGGLSTDFPAEPLMWLSCFLLIGYIFLYHRQMDFRFILHPVFVFLVIHLFWIIFTTIVSNELLISIKYTFAKSWYLVCFVLIPLVLFRDIKDFRQWAFFIFIPLLATVLIILIRHSQYGFTFSTINNAIVPIYRNHVDYAAMLGIVLPFIWMMRKWLVTRSARLFAGAGILLVLLGIYFSYTRAAWLCVPLAILAYYIIRFRLMRVVIPIALGCCILIAGWLAYENAYLEFAPDFDKTITHKKFDDLVSATYRMEDISTVERFYRWIAGYYMVKESPFVGFGPASFYSLYHSYVDRHFTTYVSDNPEHSGMHNYYFMVAVEQGLIGLAIFICLIIVVMLYGESLYHRMEAGFKKQFLMAALVSFTCNLWVLTLNDMVETDKLGSFFFFCIAVVILFGMQEKFKPDTPQVIES